MGEVQLRRGIGYRATLPASAFDMRDIDAKASVPLGRALVVEVSREVSFGAGEEPRRSGKEDDELHDGCLTV
jgi:hypothetical protein